MLPRRVSLAAVIGLVFGLGASSSCMGQGATAAGTIPENRVQDSYAIYSLLVPGEFLSRLGSSRNSNWAIAGTTINVEDMNPPLAPDAVLRAPAKHPGEFREAVADYYRRKNERFLLMRDFKLDHSYVLLSPSEVEEFRASRTAPNAPSALQQKYSGYPGITYFSQVFFNSTQTAALVYVLDWCGNLCAQAEWVYLEKQDRRWVRRSGKAPR